MRKNKEMEAKESLRIIEQMFKESKRSLVRNSFFFILWAVIMIPTGVLEWFLIKEGYSHSYFIWPIAGSIGGVISFVYGMKHAKHEGVMTGSDRIMNYTWGAFGFCMIFSIFYAVKLKQPPHALILMLAGGSTFISGGISKFRAFIYGGIALQLAALTCAFIVEPEYQGLIFSVGLVAGYLIPGILLRKEEDE